MADAWWTIEDAPAAESEQAAGGMRETIPDGEHELQILHQAAEAERLALRFSDIPKRYAIVFVDFYKAKKDGTPNTRARAQMAELAAALGLTAEQWLEAIAAGDLVGRRVMAKTRQWQQGERLRVAVDKFSPAPPAEPPKAKRGKKVEGQPLDDIPF